MVLAGISRPGLNALIRSSSLSFDRHKGYAMQIALAGVDVFLLLMLFLSPASFSPPLPTRD